VLVYGVEMYQRIKIRRPRVSRWVGTTPRAGLWVSGGNCRASRIPGSTQAMDCRTNLVLARECTSTSTRLWNLAGKSRGNGLCRHDSVDVTSFDQQSTAKGESLIDVYKQFLRGDCWHESFPFNEFCHQVRRWLAHPLLRYLHTHPLLRQQMPTGTVLQMISDRRSLSCSPTHHYEVYTNCFLA